MYKKVSSDMNFVDREKETVKFWKENEILKRVSKKEKTIRHIHSMTDHQQLMVNHISDTF